MKRTIAVVQPFIDEKREDMMKTYEDAVKDIHSMFSSDNVDILDCIADIKDKHEMLEESSRRIHLSNYLYFVPGWEDNLECTYQFLYANHDKVINC